MKRVTANSTVSSQNQNDLFVINTVDNRQNVPKTDNYTDFTKGDQIKGIARVVAHYNDSPSAQQESSSSMSSTISASILTQELLSLVKKSFFLFQNYDRSNFGQFEKVSRTYDLWRKNCLADQLVQTLGRNETLSACNG